MRNIFKISREFSENLSKIFATSTESVVTSTEPDATSTESDATSIGSARSQGYGCADGMSVRDVHSIYLKLI